MIVKLLTEHQFLSLKEAVQARLSLHMSKCHIVGNFIPRLISRIFWRKFNSLKSMLEGYISVCNDKLTQLQVSELLNKTT